jgi:hypothetical protein
MNQIDFCSLEGWTRSRRKDRATSKEAGEAASRRGTEIQMAVMEYAVSRGEAGFTDRDLSEHFDDRGSTYRTRRSELTDKGYIIDAGATRTYAGSNRRHTVWKVRPNE